MLCQLLFLNDNLLNVVNLSLLGILFALLWYFFYCRCFTHFISSLTDDYSSLYRVQPSTYVNHRCVLWNSLRRLQLSNETDRLNKQCNRWSILNLSSNHKEKNSHVNKTVETTATTKANNTANTVNDKSNNAIIQWRILYFTI